MQAAPRSTALFNVAGAGKHVVQHDASTIVIVQSSSFVQGAVSSAPLGALLHPLAVIPIVTTTATPTVTTLDAAYATVPRLCIVVASNHNSVVAASRWRSFSRVATSERATYLGELRHHAEHLESALARRHHPNAPRTGLEAFASAMAAEKIEVTKPPSGLYGAMKAILYGSFAYVLFLATFAYTVGFVECAVVPRSLEAGPAEPTAVALAVDCGWFLLFALQHSGMARRSFKRRWSRIVPEGAERSTYVLVSSLMLALLFATWRPIPIAIWNVEQPFGRWALIAASLGGWMLVLASSFSIDHAELFGLRQVVDAARGRAACPPVFRTPLLYRLVRHPLYLGFIIAFMATPRMTVGHLVFAISMIAYIAIGMRFEERDLLRTFGDDYRRYQARVPALLPWPRPRASRASRPAVHA
jgi:protein-S-isoprenylcysteine O-methyltransferase Ste14